MGSIHHANAKTTAKLREEIQKSKESIAALAVRLSLNPKTVQKWRKAGRVTDAASGPKKIKSTLTEREQQIVCEFRRVGKLPLDETFLALRDNIPNLTRSNLHRCLQRNGLSVLPKEDEHPREKKQFKDYEVGFVHVDITTIQLGGGIKYSLFVGICRVSKFAYIELHDDMTAKTACAFLKNMIAECPFKIHRLLTDNGAQFTYALLAEHLKPKNKTHPFDAICAAHTITHKLTKFKHPWTNGQVEIFNKTIKQATVKQFHYDTVKQLNHHLMAYLLVHNFQKKLKSLKFQTPYDFLLLSYKKSPQLFKHNTYHKIVGLNI